MSLQNRAIADSILRKLLEVPYEIKDVLLMVNCRDMAQRVFAGSCFIYLPSSFPSLSAEEKSILLAEFVKRLEISVEDVARFLGGNM